MICSPGEHKAITVRLRAAGCVFAEDEARLLESAAQTSDELAAMAVRRAEGAPIEHVVGWAQFRGLRIPVRPGVFVPRRRTEFLVDRAIHLLRIARCRADRPARALPVVVDLCCGSGAVGAAIAAEAGPVELSAADIDPAAVRCARLALERCGARVYLGNLFEALPRTLRGSVDLIAANVPYVPSAEIGLLPAEARLHEPVSALDGGGDGLDILRVVAAGAPEWLKPGGHLLTETSLRQADLAASVLRGCGLVPDIAVATDLEVAVVAAAWPGQGAGRTESGR